MNPHGICIARIKNAKLCIAVLPCWMLFFAIEPARAIMIVPDYTYDTINNFFDTQAKKDALQAAADRFSAIITSSLTAVGPSGTGSGTPAGWRIGFTHPGTGASYQVSTAADFASDPLSGMGAANVYGFAGLTADVWILYAGGRALGSAATGGTGTGANDPATFSDLSGPMHRGVISELSPSSLDIPAWGGSISFDNDGDVSWHFDTTTAAPSGTVDFYTVALHEIGHALGLNLGWNQFTVDQTGASYDGSESLAAYNADNGATEMDLSLVNGTNRHWDDDTYDSYIFSAGSPNYIGTVGPLVLQDLLMEPQADFTATIRRLELTNVDVAQLRDLGWSTVAVPEASAILSFGLISSVLAIGYVRRAMAAKLSVGA